MRQALRQWLKQRAVDRFEQEWMASLERHTDDGARADDWLTVQEWSRKGTAAMCGSSTSSARAAGTTVVWNLTRR